MQPSPTSSRGPVSNQTPVTPAGRRCRRGQAAGRGSHSRPRTSRHPPRSGTGRAATAPLKDSLGTARLRLTGAPPPGPPRLQLPPLRWRNRSVTNSAIVPVGAAPARIGLTQAEISRAACRADSHQPVTVSTVGSAEPLTREPSGGANTPGWPSNCRRVRNHCINQARNHDLSNRLRPPKPRDPCRSPRTGRPRGRGEGRRRRPRPSGQ